MNLPDRPLAALPRWGAAALLIATILACVWNVFALEAHNSAHEADIEHRLALGERVDMDLYRAIDARVAAGENYYEAAAKEHREFGMPTSPFVTIRTPVLAWTSALWGSDGWRAIAAFMWGANVLAWYAALRGRGRVEAAVGAGLAALFGMVAFIPDIPFSHELLAGLMLSLALALSVGRLWISGLILAGCAIALRELALPFLLAWGSAALLAGERAKVLTSLAGRSARCAAAAGLVGRRRKAGGFRQRLVCRFHRCRCHLCAAGKLLLDGTFRPRIRGRPGLRAACSDRSIFGHQVRVAGHPHARIAIMMTMQ